MPNTFKDIAVFFDTSAVGLRILETAAQLASAQSAHLIGISSAAGDGGAPASGFAIGGGLRDAVRRREQSAALRLLHAGKALGQAALRHDVHAEFRAISHTQAGAEAALYSLYCDLLAVASPAVGTPLAWSVTQVLERTGVPLLLLPHGWKASVGRRVVMAWNASRQARRALADALPLLAAAELVDLLIVDPYDGEGRHGEEPGADIAAYLARHGAKVEVRRVLSQGKGVAETILDYALARAADLVVFGAYSRPRFSEALFGGVTRTLLGTGKLPLFISH